MSRAELMTLAVLALSLAPRAWRRWAAYRRKTQPQRTAIRLSRYQTFREKQLAKRAARARLDALHRREA